MSFVQALMLIFVFISLKISLSQILPYPYDDINVSTDNITFPDPSQTDRGYTVGIHPSGIIQINRDGMPYTTDSYITYTLIANQFPSSIGCDTSCLPKSGAIPQYIHQIVHIVYITSVRRFIYYDLNTPSTPSTPYSKHLDFPTGIAKDTYLIILGDIGNRAGIITWDISDPSPSFLTETLAINGMVWNNADIATIGICETSPINQWQWIDLKLDSTLNRSPGAHSDYPSNEPTLKISRSRLSNNKTYSPTNEPTANPTNEVTLNPIFIPIGCWDKATQKEVIADRMYVCSGIIESGGITVAGMLGDGDFNHWRLRGTIYTEAETSGDGVLLYCIGSESKYECIISRIINGLITSHYQGISYVVGNEYNGCIDIRTANNKYEIFTNNDMGITTNSLLAGYQIIAGDTASIQKNKILQTSNYSEVFRFYDGRTSVEYENGWITNKSNNVETAYLYKGNGVDYTINSGNLENRTAKLGINTRENSSAKGDCSSFPTTEQTNTATKHRSESIENQMHIKYLIIATAGLCLFVILLIISYKIKELHHKIQDLESILVSNENIMKENSKTVSILKKTVSIIESQRDEAMRKLVLLNKQNANTDNKELIALKNKNIELKSLSDALAMNLMRKEQSLEEALQAMHTLNEETIEIKVNETPRSSKSLTDADMLSLSHSKDICLCLLDDEEEIDLYETRSLSPNLTPINDAEEIDLYETRSLSSINHADNTQRTSFSKRIVPKLRSFSKSLTHLKNLDLKSKK